MGNLSIDERGTYAQLDPGEMYRRIEDLPLQMEDAWRRAGEIDLPDELRSVRSILVCGMGGSAIGGSLLESYGADRIQVPFAVWRNYGLPAYADENTLVVAVSYSGNTEETVSALLAARERGCRLLAITTDGRVAEFANVWQIPMMTFLYEAQPRATLGYLFTPLVRIFERLGFLDSQQEAYEEAVRVVRAADDEWGADVPMDGNPAKQMASDCRGRAVAVYGAGYLSAVARRWKTQINENAKNWAFWEEFPELNHNAIVGYEYPRDHAEDMRVIMLSGSHLSPRVRVRMDVTRELLSRFNVKYHLAEARGEGKLAHMFSLVALGDYVSYYLALLNGADPTTIEPIDILKSALARAEIDEVVEPIQESGVPAGLTVPRAPEG